MKTLLKAYNDLRGRVFVSEDNIPEDLGYLIRDGLLEFSGSLGNGIFYINTIEGIRKAKARAGPNPN